MWKVMTSGRRRGGDAAEAGGGQAAGRSRDSEHSFEHLSDHFGSPSPVGSRTSFDGLSGGASADDMLAGASAGPRRGAAAGPDVDPVVAATVQAAVDAVVAAAEKQQAPAPVPTPLLSAAAGEPAAAAQDSEPTDGIVSAAREPPADVEADGAEAGTGAAAMGEAAEDGRSVPQMPASALVSFSTTPLGSSYADLAGATDFEESASPTDAASEAEPLSQAVDDEVGTPHCSRVGNKQGSWMVL